MRIDGEVPEAAKRSTHSFHLFGKGLMIWCQERPPFRRTKAFVSLYGLLAIKNIYDEVKTSVQTHCGITKRFPCKHEITPTINFESLSLS